MYLTFSVGILYLKRNINIKKKHVQWMCLQAQGTSFQAKKWLKTKGGYAKKCLQISLPEGT